MAPDQESINGTVIQNYRVYYELGSGIYGTVFLAKHIKTNEFFALKFISRELFKSKDHAEHLERELRIYPRLNHPNITKLYDILYTEDSIVLVMEAVRGTLEEYIKNGNTPTPHFFYKTAKQILEALVYLHSKGYAHHDIKPENIGFDNDMNVKLLDFSFITENSENCELGCGTPPYIAPEVFIPKPYDATKADIWSLGVTLCTILSDKVPEALNSTNTLQTDMRKIFRIIEFNFADDMKSFIKLFFVKDPKKRMSAQEILETNSFAEYKPALITSYSNKCIGNQKIGTAPRRPKLIIPTIRTKPQF